MIFVTIALLFAVTLNCNVSAKTVTYRSTERCTISLRRHLREPQPLLINPGLKQFVLPESSAGDIVLNRNEVIELYCSRGFRRPFNGDTIYASCVNGTQFVVDNRTVEFSRLICNDLSDHTQKVTNRTCIDGRIVQIGFQVKQDWLSLLDVCHDEVRGTNHWVRFYQNPENEGFQRGYPRIGFIQGPLFPGLAVNNLYTRFVQRRTIAGILGSTELAASLIHETNDLFLARGHLAARSDYIFGLHQQATFYFTNAAPQWQTFNAGNWDSVERGLRRFVDRRNLNILIYTGTYGVIKFNDTNGIPQEIYLSPDDVPRRIPVPKIFYKIAIAEDLKAGIVFVGVNNPYVTLNDIKREYLFCNDVSDKVDYIGWSKHNITLGYSYACSVPEFAKYIQDLPPLPEVDRLLI